MLNVCFERSEYGLLRWTLMMEYEEETLPFFSHLNIGGIRPDGFAEARRAVIRMMNPHASREVWEETWQEECRCFEAILRAAREDGELRVWVSQNPASVCGFFCLMSALEGIDCKLYCLEIPRSIKKRPAGYDTTWDMLEPPEVLEQLRHQREIGRAAREFLARVWEKLCEENAALRVNEEALIKSVPADHLDGEILAAAPTRGEFSKQSLVGWAMRSRHYMWPGFIEQRIDAMTEAGLFTVVRSEPIGDGVMATTLRLSQT